MGSEKVWEESEKEILSREVREWGHCLGDAELNESMTFQDPFGSDTLLSNCLGSGRENILQTTPGLSKFVAKYYAWHRLDKQQQQTNKQSKTERKTIISLY